MDDWRIPKELEKLYDEHYNTMQLLQIIFPAFWQRAYKTKNNFYQYVLADAMMSVKEVGYEEYLQDERVKEFWHIHCNFCTKKITTDMQEECYRAVDDEHTWICADCFNGFKERFEWTAHKNAQDIPT